MKMNQVPNYLFLLYKKQALLGKRYTPITTFIHMIFGFNKKTWYKVALFFGGSSYFMLTLFLVSRVDYINHSGSTIFFIYLAAFWAWVGPLLIWKYEHITSTRFIMRIKDVINSLSDIHSLNSLKKKSVTDGVFPDLFLLIWTCTVLTAFLLSYDYMRGLGIKSYHDPWWILQISGIALYAFMTGIGFLLVIRTMAFVHRIMKSNLRINPYHPDGRGGLGCCGSLLSDTSWMFSSGTLFLPILIRLSISNYPGSVNLIIILIGIYIIMIAASFVVPTMFLHNKLRREKYRMLKSIGKFLHTTKIPSSAKSNQYFGYILERGKYTDVQKIITWPFNEKNIANFITMVALPVILTVAQLIFAKK